jgi:hypothetical protein
MLRRFLLQALVRTVAVVVPGVPGQDTAEVPLAEDQHVVQALARSVPTNRSANAFARGDRTGVLITRVPFPAKTPSNAACACCPGRGSGTCCDTRSHVVSELVEEVGLMPVT